MSFHKYLKFVFVDIQSIFLTQRPTPFDNMFKFIHCNCIFFRANSSQKLIYSTYIFEIYINCFQCFFRDIFTACFWHFIPYCISEILVLLYSCRKLIEYSFSNMKSNSFTGYSWYIDSNIIFDIVF